MRWTSVPRLPRKRPVRPADQEEADEAEHVDHRRVPLHRAAEERRRPVEGLDRGGHGHEVGEGGEDHRRVHRHARDEHVVGPDQEADRGDGEARHRDEAVAEDALAREAGDDLADHPHRGQDHDVDGGVRVEPEQVLEEDRVAAAVGVEEAEVEDPLEGHEQDRDRDHRRPQDLDDRGRVVGPHEERHAEPGHARRPHLVDGDDEVEAGQDRGEPGHEDPDRRDLDVALGEDRRCRGCRRSSRCRARRPGARTA